MNVYVITLLENNKIVGVFNTENDILAEVLGKFYDQGYCDEDPELVAEFIALWVIKGIECLEEFGFGYVTQILN